MPAALLRRPLRMVVVAVVAGTMLPAVLHPVSGLAQEGDSNQIRPVGKLARIGPEAIQAFGDKIVPKHYYEPIGTGPRRSTSGAAVSGTLILLEEARQLWQIFPFADFTERTGFLIRDLDSMKVTHSFVANVSLRRATPLKGGEWLHATDGRRRLFFADLLLRNTIEFDLQTFAMTKRPIPPPWTAAGSQVTGFLPAGMAYDKVEDQLVLVHGGVPAAADVNNFLTWIDLKTDVSRVRQVRSCNGGQPSVETGATYSMNPMFLEKAVFFPCHRAGSVGAVVRLPRQGLFDPHGPEDMAIGPVSLETSFVDPVSERVFLVTALGEIWAFDTRTMDYIGVVSANAEATSSISAGFGIDPVSGRLFFLSPTYGVGVAEGRFFPVPQARRYLGFKADGQERIWSDHRTGRFFVLPGVDQDKAFDYTVFNSGTAPSPPAPPDPDRNTADIEEGPGTDARYFGSAGGYGFRALLAKGVVTVAPAPGVGVQAPTAKVIDDHVNSKCGYTDRELVAGRVAQAEYDTGSSAARAVALDVDDRTKQDLRRPSRCDVTGRDSAGNEVFRGIFSTSPLALPDDGKEWKYVPAACSAGEGDKEETSSEGDNQGEPALGENSVTCPLPGDRLVASATSGALTGGVRVGSAETSVDIEKVRAKGLVANAVSVARDIDIAGVIQIAEVRSTAGSRANGRPSKGDMSTHSLSIAGVVVNGVRICGDQCPIPAVVDALNQAAVGRAQFRAASGLDDGLRKGSPRGASTAVQKSPRRQASDRALVGDSSNEVPGLEMTFYNDNEEFGRARQVYQFAGVTTTATYNIVALPSLTALLDDDGPTRPDGLSIDTPIADGTGGGAVESLFPTSAIADRPPSEGSGLVGAIRRAVRAVGEGLALIVTDPRRAFLVLTAWMVIVAPAALARRRARLPRRPVLSTETGA